MNWYTYTTVNIIRVMTLATSPGLDWFVEGRATSRFQASVIQSSSEVKREVIDHKIPKTLDQYWTGN